MKYGLKGTIPATVNNKVGSCGMRLAEGTTVWPRSLKKPENAERNWSALRGVEEEDGSTMEVSMLPTALPPNGRIP
jgi:hypothetical protein